MIMFVLLSAPDTPLIGVEERLQCYTKGEHTLFVVWGLGLGVVRYGRVVVEARSDYNRFVAIRRSRSFYPAVALDREMAPSARRSIDYDTSGCVAMT